MKHFFGAAILTAFGLSHAGAQTDIKLPELPNAPGAQNPQPALPSAPTNFNPDVATGNPSPTATPQRPLTEEEMKRIKQDENWLVEGMKKQQEQDAAAALTLKKSEELKSKTESPTKQPGSDAGEMSTFKPVLSDSSLASLNPNFKDSKSEAAKKKTSFQDPLPMQAVPMGNNPLATSSSPLVQPILGPSRQPLNTNVASLNPGVGTKALPETGIKKLSSNPNFIPEGYTDSWTKLQEGSPYAPVVQPPVKALPSAAPPTPRPTFRDLANTIPDPTQVR